MHVQSILIPSVTEYHTAVSYIYHPRIPIIMPPANPPPVGILYVRILFNWAYASTTSCESNKPSPFTSKIPCIYQHNLLKQCVHHVQFTSQKSCTAPNYRLPRYHSSFCHDSRIHTWKIIKYSSRVITYHIRLTCADIIKRY